eukprot:TRINITY_DN64231_c0_g1_i1.p1 TRINITY_DN64231_c0_g1~~TRINITY_DN64231_c0_g1_i1.p1  ORF type:complete len:539 (-),score=130.03 TRINITY_DN64231_c0_g1_i1:30-1646(-)
MSSFVIAGKADDPSFARAEYAAKQVQAIVPNIHVRLEMKHPDHWKEFFNTICRQYDFAYYSEDFAGPLVWTLEGDLVGGSADFVQNICMEKFGIKDPPAVTDPVFKQIASDNLKQVKQQLQREHDGAPLAECCDAARAKAQAEGLLCSTVFSEKKQMVLKGSCVEVWTCPSLVPNAESCHQEYGSGQPARIASGLQVCAVGQEASHLVLLHPTALVEKQLVLVPRRLTRELTRRELDEEAVKGSSKVDDTAPDATPIDQDTAAATPADASHAVESMEGVPSQTEEELSKVSVLEVQQHKFRQDTDEDLSLQDFIAAMELLLNVGGVATWSGIRGGCEYRHPLETHIQVLPFPLHSAGDASPLRYPLELQLERALHDGQTALPSFPFRHMLTAVAMPDGARNSPVEYAKAAMQAYEAAIASPDMGGPRQPRAMAFTSSWMIVMPLAPPEEGSARHEAWLKLPPLHPCGLCGLVVTPPIEQSFPETAGGAPLKNGCLVSTRAEEESIPEGSPEYEVACREVRISCHVSERPFEAMGVWAL